MQPHHKAEVFVYACCRQSCRFKWTWRLVLRCYFVVFRVKLMDVCRTSVLKPTFTVLITLRIKVAGNSFECLQLKLYYTDKQTREMLIASSKTEGTFLLRCSHHRHGQALSCRWCKQNGDGDKSTLFSVVLTAFRDWTKQFGNFLSPTVLTCRQCSHRRHGQDKTVSCWPCLKQNKSVVFLKAR